MFICAVQFCEREAKTERNREESAMGKGERFWYYFEGRIFEQGEKKR
jgi:hypothetical protein